MMKTTGFLAVTTMGLLLASGNAAGVEIRIGFHDGHHQARHGHHQRGHGHHSRHGHSALHYTYPLIGHLLHRSYSHSRSRHYHNQHRFNHAYNSTRYSCQQVYKHGYYHGRRARIGGTQCYDRHGNPYIVQGSRYVVDYY